MSASCDELSSNLLSQSGDLVIGHVVGGGKLERLCLLMLLLNEFSEGTLNIDSGSAYYGPTIMLLKLLLLTFKRAVHLNSLRLCHVNVNRASISTLSIPFMLLYTCTMFALSRLYFSVDKPRVFRLFS